MMDWKLGVFAIIAVLIIILVPFNAAATISSEEALEAAENVSEVRFFKSLYPDAAVAIEEKACVEKWFEEYVRDDSVPLMAREKQFACFEEDKDWVITYSATGIVDTPGLRVGIDSKDKSVIDASFTSPYDDVHVMNYSVVTLLPVLEVIMNKSELVTRDGWVAFEEDGTKYLAYMMPTSEKLTVLLYIENTPEYKVPTTENFLSELDAAHGTFETGAKKFSTVLRAGFVEDFNVSSYYLFFPTPATTP